MVSFKSNKRGLPSLGLETIYTQHRAEDLWKAALGKDHIAVSCTVARRLSAGLKKSKRVGNLKQGYYPSKSTHSLQKSVMALTYTIWNDNLLSLTLRLAFELQELSLGL